MKIAAAFKNDRLLKSLTGLTKTEFNNLLISFEQLLYESLANKSRKRKVGGGRKGSLKAAAEKLFFILFYMKIYPTFDLAGFVFGVDRSRTCRWVHQFLPLLEKALGRRCVLPKRQITSIEEFTQLFPEVKDLFIDGVERKTQHPKLNKNKHRLYSGKSKTHTRKNLICSNYKKQILVLSPTKNGRRHDKKLFDKEDWGSWIPPSTSPWVDTGFIGISTNCKEIFIPKKRSKNHPLTDNEKAENKAISSIRIKVEHAIAGLKRFAAASGILRSKKGQDDKFMLVAAGLWNFHLQMS